MGTNLHKQDASLMHSAGYNDIVSVNTSLMSALSTKFASMLPDTAPIAVSVIVAKLIDVCQDYTVGNWRSHNVAKREKRDWHFSASLMFFNFSS